MTDYVYEYNTILIDYILTLSTEPPKLYYYRHGFRPHIITLLILLTSHKVSKVSKNVRLYGSDALT